MRSTVMTVTIISLTLAFAACNTPKPESKQKGVVSDFVRNQISTEIKGLDFAFTLQDDDLVSAADPRLFVQAACKKAQPGENDFSVSKDMTIPVKRDGDKIVVKTDKGMKVVYQAGNMFNAACNASLRLEFPAGNSTNGIERPAMTVPVAIFIPLKNNGSKSLKTSLDNGALTVKLSQRTEPAGCSIFGSYEYRASNGALKPMGFDVTHGEPKSCEAFADKL